MIIPTLYRVIVRPEIVEETKKGSSIILPEEVRDREQFGIDRGTLVAWGPEASLGSGVSFNKGERVIYARYAGCLVTDDDGTDYRIMNDKEVLALVRAEEGVG